jgi:HEAT repeat protein
MGLAERGEQAACPALQAARQHPDSQVRERVASALQRLDC